MMSLIYETESFALRDSFYSIYNIIGAGFDQSIYHECFELECKRSQIPMRVAQEFKLEYRGVSLRHVFKVDFVCFDEIIVQIKSTSEITSQHRDEMKTLLKVSGFRCGFIVNFGSYPHLQSERIIL